MLTPQDIIKVAKISEYLAGNDANISELFTFSTPVADLPKRIYMENKALQFIYNNPVTLGNGGTADQVAAYNQQLTQVANYVYELCGYYAIIAGSVIANVGGGISIGGSATVLTPVFRWFYFTVGSGNPITNTTTVFTINQGNVVSDSIAVTNNGSVMPPSALGQASYTYVITSSGITFTFNQNFNNGDVVGVCMEYFR